MTSKHRSLCLFVLAAEAMLEELQFKLGLCEEEEESE